MNLNLSAFNDGKRLSLIKSMLQHDCTIIYDCFQGNRIFLKMCIELYEEFIIKEINTLFENSNSFGEIVQKHQHNFEEFLQSFRREINENVSFRGAGNTMYVIYVKIINWFYQGLKGQNCYTMVEIDAFDYHKYKYLADDGQRYTVNNIV